MSQYRIYHNPRCSKSRQTLGMLEEKGIQPDVILYMESPPSANQLEQVIRQLGISARELLRRGEDEYRELNLAEPALTDSQLIEAMVSHPKLIERPIVIKGSRAVLGRPPENVLTLIKS
jgi:arsenate reductase